MVVPRVRTVGTSTQSCPYCWSSSPLYKHNVSEVGCHINTASVRRIRQSAGKPFHNDSIFIIISYTVSNSTLYKRTITFITKGIQIRGFIVNCHRLCCLKNCWSTTIKEQDFLTLTTTLLLDIIVFNFHRSRYYFQNSFEINCLVIRLLFVVLWLLKLECIFSIFIKKPNLQLA